MAYVIKSGPRATDADLQGLHLTTTLKNGVKVLWLIRDLKSRLETLLCLLMRRSIVELHTGIRPPLDIVYTLGVVVVVVVVIIITIIGDE